MATSRVAVKITGIAAQIPSPLLMTSRMSRCFRTWSPCQARRYPWEKKEESGEDGEDGEDPYGINEILLHYGLPRKKFVPPVLRPLPSPLDEAPVHPLMKKWMDLYTCSDLPSSRKPNEEEEEEEKKRTPPTTEEWLLESARTSAAHGNSFAWYHLALHHLNGVAVPRNEALGVKCLQKASQMGCGDAQVAMGLLSLTGDATVPKDPVAAREWFSLAGRNGSGPAYYYLGLLYMGGIGGTKDEAAAAQAFKDGTARCDPMATSAYAAFLKEGRGVSRDVELGEKFQRLARQRRKDYIAQLEMEAVVRKEICGDDDSNDDDGDSNDDTRDGKDV